MTHFKMTMGNRVWSLICRNISLHTFSHVFRGIECLSQSEKETSQYGDSESYKDELLGI